MCKDCGCSMGDSHNHDHKHENIHNDIGKVKRSARKLKQNVDIVEISYKDENSINRFIEWIEYKLEFSS